MNLREYREQIGRIPYGKRLPTALYVHREGLVNLGGGLGAVLDRVVARYQVSAEFSSMDGSDFVLKSPVGYSKGR